MAWKRGIALKPRWLSTQQGMSGRQRQIKRWRRREGADEHMLNAATWFAAGRQRKKKKRGDRQRRRNTRGLRSSADRMAVSEQQRLSEGQQEPGGVQSGAESYIIE